jgi:hypothetical protein
MTMDGATRKARLARQRSERERRQKAEREQDLDRQLRLFKSAVERGQVPGMRLAGSPR